MKRTLGLLTVLCLLVSLLPVSAAINVPTTTMYVKTANGKPLKLRAEPDAKAEVITDIPYGAEVSVYADFVGMVWYHIQYGMYMGYVKAEFLVQKKPKPFVTPTPKPTARPTAKPTARPTATPAPLTPEEFTAQEIAAAKKLGLVPQGMTTDGHCTWQELDALLTNLLKIKSNSTEASRNHVYLSLDEYKASNAGSEFGIVLRGVAAAEMYGALIDMGEENPVLEHLNDPFISDAGDIALCQEYAGIDSSVGGWRALPMQEMVVTILDHVDNLSGRAVMSQDDEAAFRPTHPLTQTEAITAVYRLYNSFHHGIGRVTVTHKRQANIRANPSMSASIVGKVNPGDMFTVISIPSKGWYQIQLSDGTMPYISGGMVAYEAN